MLLWFGSVPYAADPAMPRVALQDPVDPAMLSRIVTALGRPPLGIAVRVPIDLERSAADVDGRLAAYEARGVRLWPVVDLPPDLAGVARWRTLLQQWLARHRAHLAVLELRVTEQALPFAGFAIQAAATDLRASAGTARLAVGGPIATPDNLTGLQRLIDASVAPYVELVAVSSRASADQAIASLKAVAPSVKAVLVEQRLPIDPDAARTLLIDLHVASLASDVVAIAVEGDSPIVEAAVGGLRPLVAAVDRRGGRDRRRGVVAEAQCPGTGRLGAGPPPPPVREPHVRDVSDLPVRGAQRAARGHPQRAHRRDGGRGGPEPRKPGAG